MVKYVIQNADKASYANAWNDYTVFYSTQHSDTNSWTRNLDTVYQDGQLSWAHTKSECSVYFSYVLSTIFLRTSLESHCSMLSEHSRLFLGTVVGWS